MNFGVATGLSRSRRFVQTGERQRHALRGARFAFMRNRLLGPGLALSAGNRESERELNRFETRDS